MAGTRGPVPKRSTQRRRRNKPDGEAVSRARSDGTVRGPALGIEDVHPLAAEWYESLRVSGQSVFFEPSDWAQAKVWTATLSSALSGGRVTATLIEAWSSGASELLTTEGARRRMRVELSRADDGTDADEDAAVVALDEYAARLTS